VDETAVEVEENVGLGTLARLGLEVALEVAMAMPRLQRREAASSLREPP